jgi:SWI/SNF-related matrix-associated actin-dependent regulator of chromatin subfamily A member 5
MIRLKENGINGILADEMGLGKTLQSISVLGYMMEYDGIRGPHLVMVPKSTLSNWCNEFARWCPSLRIIRFHGNKDERLEMAQQYLRPAVAQEDRDWDVCITTYEIVNLERTTLGKMAWRYLIIDEAHRLKNEESQFSQTVRMLSTQYRLLLTGTPLQNNLHELWALLNFLLPDVFASSEQFDEWFNLDVDDTEAKQRIINQLHKILRPFMLRRLKLDVEKSLPPKSETILFTGMSTIQKNLYRQILLRDIDTVNGGNSGSRTAVLNIVMQLRKCCNHPYLFPGIEDRSLDPLGDHLHQACGKMVLLDKLLAKMKERGHRILIFSQMTRMLDILEDYLISKGYLYCRIDGNTSYDDREDRIADYNREGSDKFVFLLSTRAGGLGINLQTADTVILYDSDWNPQADLQAQDRAHRIGQKRPVQVFRLITDDSVEVKVVERAQQKLKLDAMVVQQGRLQDKEKKMSKNDLLDTIRFGADKVFRSKDSTISDDDIDIILAEGKKRTEELNEKMKVAEKGDLYDFRLDGGMSAQTFEGKDYSDRSLRENELTGAVGFAFIDTGKRERKAVTSYSETLAREAKEEATDKRPKIPRHLRLPKMEDWQFFDKDRLQELHADELRLFDEMCDRGEAPQAGNVNKFIVLDPERYAEKNRLLAEAFGDWTKVHYNSFLKASAKHGRSAYEKIAKDVGRPVDETKRYSQTFWKKGSSVLSPGDWDRVVKQIEKGEKRLEEIQRLTSATAKLIMMFNDPWEELTFRNVGNQGRIFNAVEDRFLLCLTHLHGYGSWDQVRSSIRRCERFRFDFYLQSCSADALGKRCELLMRAAERELAEIERKKQAADALSATNTRPKDTIELTKSKMEVLIKEIKAESNRLAQARQQLQKLKTKAATSEAVKKNSGAAAAASSAGASVEAEDASPEGKSAKKVKKEDDDLLNKTARTTCSNSASKI